MDIIREPYGFVHADAGRLKETYGGPSGQVFVECMRIRPIDKDSRTVILFSHPIGGGSFLPLVTALAHAGYHIIYCNPRYRGNDTALIMEKCVLDLGACIADAKKRFGYDKIVLGGGPAAVLSHSFTRTRQSILQSPKRRQAIPSTSRAPGSFPLTRSCCLRPMSAGP